MAFVSASLSCFKQRFGKRGLVVQQAQWFCEDIVPFDRLVSDPGEARTQDPYFLMTELCASTFDLSKVCSFEP